MAKFSILLSVYYKENPHYLKMALDSIVSQTVLAEEIIIIKDGILTKELDEVIDLFILSQNSATVYSLPQNVGLGKALNWGLLKCSNNLVARMDSDDIALPNRFEKQLRCFEQDSSLSIVGGAITEFIDTPDKIVAKRICPLEDSEVKQYMKSRCGFNHMTVMFKKSDVLHAGNYQDWFWNEDYYLWLRMLLCGCKFQNLPDTLVNVRVGKDMYSRRGGKKYFTSEYKLQKYMYNHRIISYPRFIFNSCIRFCIQVLMPNKLRGYIFKIMFRKK